MKNTVGNDRRGLDVRRPDDVDLAVVLDLRRLGASTSAAAPAEVLAGSMAATATATATATGSEPVTEPETEPAARPSRRRALVAAALLVAGVLGVLVAPDLGGSRPAPTTVWQHAPSAGGGSSSWDPWRDPMDALVQP